MLYRHNILNYMYYHNIMNYMYYHNIMNYMYDHNIMNYMYDHNIMNYVYDHNIMKHHHNIMYYHHNIMKYHHDIYSYGLGSRTTDPRADPFEGQTKLLLSEKPVYNCFVIHFNFFSKLSYSIDQKTISTLTSIKCVKKSPIKLMLMTFIQQE